MLRFLLKLGLKSTDIALGTTLTLYWSSYMKDQEDTVTRDFEEAKYASPSFTIGEYALSAWMQREFDKVADIYRRDCEKIFKNFNNNMSNEFARLTKSLKGLEARIDAISKAIDKAEGTKKPTQK